MPTGFLRSVPDPDSRALARLFCFPYAGSGAAIFRSWSPRLAPQIDVHPVQLPGRENRWMEPAVASLPSLVDALEQALRPYLDRPFAFFGHSMGALIGFELARQLRRHGGPSVLHLLVSGARAPQRKGPFPPLHRLPDALLVQQLRRLGGTPDDVLRNPEVMSFLLPTIRADLTLCETYVHSLEPPLDCAVSVFGGMHDTIVTYDDLVAWRGQTRGAFSVFLCPGRHFFLHTAEAEMLEIAQRDSTRSLARRGLHATASHRPNTS